MDGDRLGDAGAGASLTAFGAALVASAATRTWPQKQQLEQGGRGRGRSFALTWRAAPYNCTYYCSVGVGPFRVLRRQVEPIPSDRASNDAQQQTCRLPILGRLAEAGVLPAPPEHQRRWRATFSLYNWAANTETKKKIAEPWSPGMQKNHPVPYVSRAKQGESSFNYRAKLTPGPRV